MIKPQIARKILSTSIKALSFAWTTISLQFFTYANRLNAWARNVDLGKRSTFYGLTTFQVSEVGKLKIGFSCTFRSTYHSNLIGINHPCILSVHGDGQLEIGNSCGFSGVTLGCFKKISIGSNVRCGANVIITDSDWHLTDLRVGDPKPVIIEDNVWIGVNSIVLKGVTIGRDSIIGAGSIVSKDIPPGVIAAGNPCKPLKRVK
jgi:acetyltransferase-like isoleucine patch superfamily enzyme